MYEGMTFEVILQRLLANAPAGLDKREGSILYDALAPAAVELAKMYVELDVVLNETFADTASREYLVKRAAERGLSPYPAVCAVVKGVFDCEIPPGSRFSREGFYYTALCALETEEEGVYAYELRCETAGSAANRIFGRLTPVETVAGLRSAEIAEILIPGEDAEDTEAFRGRYFASLHSQAFGGNVVDYREKVSALPGVGGVKVYPVWNGGGTVKVVILGADASAPSAVLIQEVQTALDPAPNQGSGLGIAPIGHVVTVAGVSETTVDVSFVLTYESGWSWEDVAGYVEAVIDGYFGELNRTWAQEEQLVVRRSQIESRLLEVEGIVDVQDTKLNGTAANLVLAADAIAKRGLIVDEQDD